MVNAFPTPSGRIEADHPARSGSGLILDMLAHGIPLTLLPDLAWPGALAEEHGAAERQACTAPESREPRQGRHARAAGSETLAQALAFAACPSGRHRRGPCGRSPGADGPRRQG